MSTIRKSIKKVSLEMGIFTLINTIYVFTSTILRLTYNNLYRVLKFDKLLSFFPVYIQLKLFPSNVTNLIENVGNINITDIKWGGRRDEKYLVKFFFIDGVWDIEDKQPLDDYLKSYVYSKTVQMMFEENIDFKETPQYKEMIDIVISGQFYDWRARNCKNIEDIDQYFYNMINIYHEIMVNGYRSQKELNSFDLEDEIAVMVDRNGDIHKQQLSGHHRLMMAKILGITSIPVIVKGVHFEWAKRCLEKYGGSLPSAINQGIKNEILLKEKN